MCETKYSACSASAVLRTACSASVAVGSGSWQCGCPRWSRLARVDGGGS